MSFSCCLFDNKLTIKATSNLSSKLKITNPGIARVRLLVAIKVALFYSNLIEFLNSVLLNNIKNQSIQNLHREFYYSL